MDTLFCLSTGKRENLNKTFEKQLNSGIEPCPNRSKFDHSGDIKIRHKILPVRYFFVLQMSFLYLEI